MENVGTATSGETTTPDLVAKLSTVVTGRPVVLGFLSLSALRAFDSTDETLSKTVKAVADLIEAAGEGDLYVGEKIARMLYQADIVNKILGEGQRRYYVVDPEEALLRSRIKYVAAHSHGKSEARINVGYIGHVGRDKGTLAEALTKIGTSRFGTQVIVDDMTRGFAKQAVDKVIRSQVDLGNALHKAAGEALRLHSAQYAKPHITEKPYGRDHRKRFRR